MYLRIDEESEAANAMQMAAKFAEGVAADMRLWCWLIIALHSAAQGVMVLSLRHGNGLLALSDESYAAWVTAYEKNETPPAEKLDSYLNLYKKVKHLEFGQVGGNKRFVPIGTEGGDIKRLNALRNNFIHFTPKGWSLQVDGLPRICLSTARLISFLGLDTENVSGILLKHARSFRAHTQALFLPCASYIPCIRKMSAKQTLDKPVPPKQLIYSPPPKPHPNPPPVGSAGMPQSAPA